MCEEALRRESRAGLRRIALNDDAWRRRDWRARDHMKILIYGLNYAPELTGTGKYTAEMARGACRART